MNSRVTFGATRPATKEDLVRALGPAMRVETSPVKLRESHHRVLRLLAAGHSRKEVAMVTGMTPHRITQIQNSPLGQHTLARHREALDADMYAEVADLMGYRNSRRQRFMDLIEEKALDDVEEAVDAGLPLPKTSLELYNSMQDRYGTPKRNASFTLHGKIGADLDAAIARSEAVDAPTIEHED